jgi:antitoxin component YwqK of YwqJK toxin-antitoxin module
MSCKGKVVKTYYPNGKLHTEVSYADTIKDGSEKIYYPNGQLEIVTEYSNGIKNGEEKGYYQNGKLSLENAYLDGKENGIVKTYFPNGNLEFQAIFKKGLKNGPFEMHFENGNLDTKGNFINDKMEGVLEKHSQDGHLAQYSIMQDDTLVYQKQYHSDGKFSKEIRMLLVEAPDTISLGETYKAKISITGPVTKEADMVIIISNPERSTKYADTGSENKYLGDTVFIFKPIEKGEYHYRVWYNYTTPRETWGKTRDVSFWVK